MTPAARANPMVRKVVLARLMKGIKGRSAPIVVANPAPIVRPNASPTLPPVWMLQRVGSGQENSSTQVSFGLPLEALEQKMSILRNSQEADGFFK